MRAGRQTRRRTKNRKTISLLEERTSESGGIADGINESKTIKTDTIKCLKTME